MGKKKSNRAKRSLGALPKGLVRRGENSDPGNPFEVTSRQKRPKHLVHNRPTSKPKSAKHALESLQRRQTQLRSALKTTKKANVFIDRRIGQYDPAMSQEDQMLARLVRERTRQSQRSRKFQLEDDNATNDSDILTHKGKQLDPNQSEALYSDDEDDKGDLEAVDTELHFGGEGISAKHSDPYGGSSSADLSQVYGQRKTELDELIARRKVLKAERIQAKEAQVELVAKMDDSFAEISQLLNYRKNEPRSVAAPKITKEEREMNQWHLEMKRMMMKPKLKATDRTKTPEEVAKEEAERLHELETRRLARMNGDFEEDDFSDISDDEGDDAAKKKKSMSRKSMSQMQNPEELPESDDDSLADNGPQPTFTPDGIKYVDKDGKVVNVDRESGTANHTDWGSDQSTQPHEESGPHKRDLASHPLSEGTRVSANYRAAEQFDGHEAWYEGAISKVSRLPDGGIRYDVEYDDGDFEDDMLPENVRPVGKATEEVENERSATETENELKYKQNKARDKAR